MHELSRCLFLLCLYYPYVVSASAHHVPLTTMQGHEAAQASEGAAAGRRQGQPSPVARHRVPGPSTEAAQAGSYSNGSAAEVQLCLASVLPSWDCTA
jgi:hypothetical protein